MTSLAELEARIATVPSAIVAFSGGVDSSLVAAAAARVLGERGLAVTAVSPALATGELDGARAVADEVGIAHRAISTDELARPGYRANGPDRCYHCKAELFGLLATEIAVAMQKSGKTGLKTGIAVCLFVVALIFVYRSFYGMRIPEEG